MLNWPEHLMYVHVPRIFISYFRLSSAQGWVFFCKDRASLWFPAGVAMGDDLKEHPANAGSEEEEACTGKGRMIDKPMKYFLTVHWQEIMVEVAVVMCVVYVV